MQNVYKMFLISFVLINFAFSQDRPNPILFESFNYPVGQLTDRNGGANVSGGNWVDTSGTGNYIQVEAGTLFHPVNLNPTGNKIKIKAVTSSAEDVWRNFAPESTKAVYLSFLLEVIDTALLAANSSATAEYFIGVLASTQTTAYGSRVYMRKGIGNNYQIGIRATTNSSSATPITWIHKDLNVNEANLIILKYQFVEPRITVAGAGNDTLSCWIIDPLFYMNPYGIPQPDAISVATGGYEQPNIARVFIRQGSNSGFSTPNAYITNIIVDTLFTLPKMVDDEQLFKFTLTNLNFENPTGPAMIGTPAYAYLNYNWANNTSTTCTEENFPLVTSPASLSFKINHGDLLSYKSTKISTMDGDQRIYGIDSGFIAENNVPKLYFSQIVWFQISVYPLNFTYLGGIATIDTVRSDQAWLDSLGREIKSLEIKIESKSLIIQGAIGLYTGEVELSKSKGIVKAATTNQMAVTDFSNLNGIRNSRNIPMQMDFTPQPVYFATPHSGNNVWGNRVFAATEFRDLTTDNELAEEILEDSLNLFIYPMQTIIGSTLESYRTKLRMNISKMLSIFNDTLENVGVYVEDLENENYPDPDHLVRIPKSRITYIQPSTIVIDSVEQKGIQIFYFVKQRRSLVNVKNNGVLPKEFSLEQNYPNPFNPSTKINFSILNDGNVTLKIFNIHGQEVATLVNGKLNKGKYTVDFNASNLASGMYFYKIESGLFKEVRKMMFLK